MVTRHTQKAARQEANSFFEQPLGLLKLWLKQLTQALQAASLPI